MINYNNKLYSHKKLFDYFVDLSLKKNLPSKLLLTGLDGIGKSTFALHFINYIFSQNETTKYDLLKNEINKKSISYNHINNLSHPNFFLIKKHDDKKDIDVEQIRQMINFLNKSSFNNCIKIILIDGAEDLNLSSSNALLKSLEDSNDDKLFILTHNINRNILDTVKSRCISYKLNFNFSTSNITFFES